MDTTSFDKKNQLLNRSFNSEKLLVNINIQRDIPLSDIKDKTFIFFFANTENN
jgi:hypothetical protein